MVNVFWVSFNPDAIARGYWDQAFLEGIFDDTTWAVPGHPTVEHHVYDAPVDTKALHAQALPGGILIVPARHHAAHKDVRAIQRLAAEMRWCLLVLTGDEEGEFPVGRIIDRDHVAAWVMTPQAGRTYGNATLIGSGYPPGIREVLAEIPPEHERTLPWAFMGQVTHERRQDCANMLEARGDGLLEASPGFTQGIDQADYWRTLATAKVAPCPSGPVSADSFRVYEALEAGSVPIADNRRPGDVAQINFWENVLRMPPFPLVAHSWDAESTTIDEALEAWPHNANRVFAWWQREKRRIARKLWTDVAALSGVPIDTTSPEAAITAVMVTSPSPHHPSIEHLDITIQSIRDQLGMCEIVLVFDGIRREQEHYAEVYAEYTRRALWACNTRWRNVVPIVCDEWLHQAQATVLALAEVNTRHIIFVEHDTPLTGTIDWVGIVGCLDAGELDIIRLHHETALGPHNEQMYLEHEPIDMGVPIVRTYQYSQRPHVANVGYYRRMLELHFAPDARCFIEDVMHGIVVSAWLDYGIAGWSRFRIGMYAAPEGNWQHSLHLDSRRRVVGEPSTEDVKGRQQFSYPADPQPGAPQPGWR